MPGWVASDATRYVLQDTNFQPTSLVSVAIAVDNRTRFDAAYREIIQEKCEQYGIPFERPVIKDEKINKYVAEWEREDARREIVEQLLQIDTISNIHFTETTLGQPGNEVVPAYQTEPDKKRLVPPNQLRDEIFPYYNLVSIWDYYDRIDDRFQHSNVMIDDFDGKESYLWHHIGDRANELQVIPKGDRIYPLLSLADLTMEYVKQEVDDWSDEDVLDLLVEVTPGDSAYVNAYSIEGTDKLQTMAPISTKSADVQVHYPHPVIYIDRCGWHQKEVKSIDLYDIVCEYANLREGCVKFLDERQDRGYMKEGDYIICMDEDKTSERGRYESLNSIKSVSVISASDAMGQFTERIEAANEDNNSDEADSSEAPGSGAS